MLEINLVSGSEVTKAVIKRGFSQDGIKTGEQNLYAKMLQANFFKETETSGLNANSGLNFVRFQDQHKHVMKMNIILLLGYSPRARAYLSKYVRYK